MYPFIDTNVTEETFDQLQLVVKTIKLQDYFTKEILTFAEAKKFFIP